MQRDRPAEGGHASANLPHLTAIARRFNPTAISFTSYVVSLNKTLECPIVLSTPTDPQSYVSLLQRLYVVPPSRTPENIREATDTPIPIDQVLAHVIATVLHSHDTFIAHTKNVLTAGLFLARQEGAASILRDIDARSPSAPIQHLRSPSWRLLYRRIGHGLMRHLLLNSTLLLAILGSGGSSVFLQLCGPVSTANDYPHKRRLKRSASTINMRRDLLYYEPCRPRLQIANPGLPAANHLHNMSVNDAPLLLRLIFPTLWRKNTNPGDVRRYDTLAMTIKKAGPFPRRNIRRLRSFIPILKEVLIRLRLQSFRRLLGRYCPLDLNSHHTTADMISMSTSTKSVANFLVACTRLILPPEFFGSKRNRFAFERAVHRFIRNRFRNESFDVHRFFSESGLSVTDIPWLHLNFKRRVVNPTDLRFRQERLRDVMIWLFRGVLIPLVQQNFYATEGTLNRSRIIFFRREVWERLVDPKRGALVHASKMFSPLSKEQFCQRTSRRKSVLNHLTTTGLGSRLGPYQVLYYHHIRQIPKRESMRGIQRPRVKLLCELRDSRKRLPLSKSASCRANVKLSLNMAKSVTRSLMNSILKVLLAETRSHSEALGVSVFNLQDIYKQVLRLKQGWISRGKPRMYACCVDISKSFDTIPLQTLFSEVVPSLFSKDRYVLLRYRLSQPDVSSRFVKHRYVAHVCAEPGEETSFIRLIRQKLSPTHSGAVFSDLAMVSTMTKTDIQAAMKEFLTNNLVTFRAKKRKRSESGFALQTRGLPQGHQLSPLLTALFYAYVEKHDLASFLSSESASPCNETGTASGKGCDNATDGNRGVADSLKLFMRFIDDSVFLTSSEEEAREFMHRMAKGWRASHGFSINVEKTRSNFAENTDKSSSRPLMFIAWCGLLLDTQRMEIRVDYMRYKPKFGRLRDYIVVEHDMEPGRIFSERALNCFVPKVHALLLDSRINCAGTVAINIYQAAVLSCLKLCSYAIEVGLKRDSFFGALVERSLSNFTNLVRRSVTNHTARALGCRFQFSATEVRYLASHAYCETLERTLGRRKGKQQAARSCVDSLRTSIRSTASSLRTRRDLSIADVAEQVSRHECQELWTIPL